MLALNGRRKYFSIYHASANLSQRHHRHNQQASSFGDFLGFDEADAADWETEEDDDNDNADKHDTKLLDSMLLNGLPMWLDRLCEGSLTRLRLSEWPAMVDTLAA